MKIAGVAASFPDRVVTNVNVIEMVAKQSVDVFEGDLDKTLEQIAFFMDRIGNKNRRWLSPGEPSFNHIKSAIEQAAAQAELSLDQIDLLIHSSVDRRVVEPGNSFFIAKAMKMNCHCFDVLEACNSWTRASNIAQAFLKAGQYTNILIVTTEFAIHEGEWGYKSFTLKNAQDLDWAFGPYTMGEVATATILTPEGEDWQYRLSAQPEHAELCMCPIDDWADNIKYLGDASMGGRGGRLFVSYGKPLSERAEQPMIDLLEICPIPLEDAVAVFPHTHSKRFWVDIAKRMNRNIPFYYIFPETGNLVSGSTASSLHIAQKNGDIKRGDKLVSCIAAAGMSFALHSFEF